MKAKRVRRHRAIPRVLWIASGLVAALAVFWLVTRRRTPPPARPVCPIDLHDMPEAPSPGERFAWASPGRREGHYYDAYPTVRGEIAGCAVRVFLDTGVTNPVLAPWIAERFHIPRKPTGRSSVDLGGNTAGLDAIDPVYVTVPSVDLIAPVREVFNGPDTMLGSLGIAVVLPPQVALARDGVMALDFAARTYRRLPFAEASELARRDLTFEAIAKCSGMILVDAKIAGRPATLSVDTGSNVSVLFSESEPGRPLAAGVTKWNAQAGSAFSATQEEARTPGVRFQLGNMDGLLAFTLWKGRGRSGSECGFDGVIGTDLLIEGRCVLLFEPGPEAFDSGMYFAHVRGFCTP